MKAIPLKSRDGRAKSGETLWEAGLSEINS
jgi:hypothetical protein